MIDTLLALLVSVSVQLPTGSGYFFGENNLPVNYEVAAGAESREGRNVSELWTWYERENGEHYTGVDFKHVYMVGRLESSTFFVNRQAQGILRGGLGVAAAVAVLRLGSSVVWDHLAPAVTGNAGLRAGWVWANVAVWRDGVESFDCGVRYEYNPDSALFPGAVVPFLKAEYSFDRTRNELLQGKIGLKVKL